MTTKQLAALAVVALSAADCSNSATITRHDGSTITGEIVSSDATNLYLFTDLPVARAEISKIDHPGKVRGVIGGMLTALGTTFVITGLAPSKSDCDPGDFLCFNVPGPELALIPIGAIVGIAGVVTAISGLASWGRSRSRASGGGTAVGVREDTAEHAVPAPPQQTGSRGSDQAGTCEQAFGLYSDAIEALRKQCRDGLASERSIDEAIAGLDRIKASNEFCFDFYLDGQPFLKRRRAIAEHECKASEERLREVLDEAVEDANEPEGPAPTCDQVFDAQEQTLGRVEELLAEGSPTGIEQARALLARALERERRHANLCFGYYVRGQALKQRRQGLEKQTSMERSEKKVQPPAESNPPPPVQGPEKDPSGEAR